MKKTTRQKKHVLRNYIYSYIIVVLIPVIACGLIYVNAYNVIKNETTDAKFEMLRYFAADIDNKTAVVL